MSLIVAEQPVGYALEQSRMTAAEFLAWDEGQTVKHEFMRGEVVMMTGVAGVHNTVAMNPYIALRQHLRGTPCRIYAVRPTLSRRAASRLRKSVNWLAFAQLHRDARRIGKLQRRVADQRLRRRGQIQAQIGAAIR